mgnify:CR=1 FL=1
MENKEINLWKFLEVLALKARFIVAFIFIATAVSVIVAFILPRWYQARIILLPPKDSGSYIGMVKDLAEALTLTSGLEQPVAATPADIYVRILKSRTLFTRVIEANNLRTHYGIDSDEEIMEKMMDYCNMRVTDEGLIEIAFEDKDPQLAARVANSFAVELDSLNQEIAVSKAQGLRRMLENRLAEIGGSLDSARREIENFQRVNRAVDIDRQTQLAIESAVSLKVALAEAEININVKRKTLSDTHPEVINLQRRIDEIKGQINALEFGGADSSYFNLPVSDVPGLKLKYARLTADAKTYEALYQFISEQYEQVKIQERMSAPMVAVIDPAFVPERPVKPRKMMIVLISFAVSAVLAVFLALVMNYLSELKKVSPEDYSRAEVFLGTYFFWLPGIKKTSRR